MFFFTRSSSHRVPSQKWKETKVRKIIAINDIVRSSLTMDRFVREWKVTSTSLEVDKKDEKRSKYKIIIN